MQWSEFTDLFYERSNFLGEFGTLRGAGPYQLDPVRLDAEALQGALHQVEAAQGFIVLLDVMTFAWMASGDHHSIRTVC